MDWEVLIERPELPNESQAAILAVDGSSESPGLKHALKCVIVLDQPFTMRFQSKIEAERVAERFSKLGFCSKVQPGPDPTQRVGATQNKDTTQIH